MRRKRVDNKLCSARARVPRPPVALTSNQSPSRAPRAATRGGSAAARAACGSTWLGEASRAHHHSLQKSNESLIHDCRSDIRPRAARLEANAFLQLSQRGVSIHLTRCNYTRCARGCKAAKIFRSLHGRRARGARERPWSGQTLTPNKILSNFYHARTARRAQHLRCSLM